MPVEPGTCSIQPVFSHTFILPISNLLINCFISYFHHILCFLIFMSSVFPPISTHLRSAIPTHFCSIITNPNRFHTPKSSTH
ncbi:hypothetical protein QVD17_17730 [Tagetes erecta]|uniref:Uncharacterized protein n=1 Tax=Tagetes erecta TaxID=13708 RepID=A0AAD8L009_TARER|nr:hypothetical protein QVD17_17730 [Tagetes erecta]